jgi:hypothetical protein
MYSKKKSVQTDRKKPVNWSTVIWIIIGVLIAICMIVGLAT